MITPLTIAWALFAVAITGVVGFMVLMRRRRYVRKGDEVRFLNGKNVSIHRVTKIEGFGKYACVRFRPDSPYFGVRRDQIGRDGQGRWTWVDED